MTAPAVWRVKIATVPEIILSRPAAIPILPAVDNRSIQNLASTPCVVPFAKAVGQSEKAIARLPIIATSADPMNVVRYFARSTRFLLGSQRSTCSIVPNLYSAPKNEAPMSPPVKIARMPPIAGKIPCSPLNGSVRLGSGEGRVSDQSSVLSPRSQVMWNRSSSTQFQQLPSQSPSELDVVSKHL